MELEAAEKELGNIGIKADSCHEKPEPVIVANGVTNGVQNGQPKTIEGFENVNQKDALGYLSNYKAHKTGISHEEMVEVYTEWADNYDQDLCPGRYNGPTIGAEALADYYPSEVRPLLKILDVAAGTGRVGQEMYPYGFRHIDALEPSPGMLKKLVARGLYESTFQSAIGFHPVDNILPNTYDSLIICGGMGEGHIPVSAVDEMIRIVKPGGTIFIVMREEYLSYVQQYVGKLEPHMQSLQEKGFWKQVNRKIVPSYSFNKTGVVFIYEVLTTEWPISTN